MTNENWIVCPHCGANVKPGALACSQCGSDTDTGWSESALDGTDLAPHPDDFDYEEARRAHFEKRKAEAGSWQEKMKVAGFVLIVAGIIAYFVIGWGR
jgi:uncharacterized membrane protein YvbJ